MLEIRTREDRLFELENGILVEKAMGWYESLLAMLIGSELNRFLKSHDLGNVLGADGAFRILPGVVKIPDVSFVSWQRRSQVGDPGSAIPSVVPDLVVEVLSESNTPAEMDEKLKTYFRAGVRRVWHLDPRTRTAKSFASSEGFVTINEDAC